MVKDCIILAVQVIFQESFLTLAVLFLTYEKVGPIGIL